MAIRFVRNQRGTDFTVHDERYPNIQCAVSVDASAKQYRFQGRTFNDPESAVRAAVGFIRRSVAQKGGEQAMIDALAGTIREISTNEEDIIQWE